METTRKRHNGNFTDTFESHWISQKRARRGTCGMDQPYHTGAPGLMGRYSYLVCGDVEAVRKYEVIKIYIYTHMPTSYRRD